MIFDRRAAFEKIIVSVPDFQPRYQEFLADWQDEDTPWYLAMGELAHYIVETYEQGDTGSYAALFSSIDEVLGSGDSEIQNLIQVGLLEDIQNIASHRHFGPDVFCEWLGPISLDAWNEVNKGMQKIAERVSQRRAPCLPSSPDVESVLSQVKNPELRRIVEQMYRKNN